MAPLTIADHLIFALIAFVLPIIVIWKRRGPDISIPQITALKIKLYWLNSLILWVGALVVIILWLICDRSFYTLGFRLPDAQDFPHWGILTGVFILLYFADVVFSWHSDKQPGAAGILPANWREFIHFGSIVSLSAGICEELVFRGFFILYLLTLFEGHPSAIGIAVAGSAFVFGIAHEYQGGLALVKITLLSVLFAALFILTESLLLVMFLHFAVDFTSGLLAVIRFKSMANTRTQPIAHG